MPNRILREGVLTSARVDLLTVQEEIFYRRLMSVVDDFGRYYATPMLLRAACYPLRLDKVSDQNISDWLAALHAARLIVVYEASGANYLEMLDFRQQQRAIKSKFPEPTGKPIDPPAPKPPKERAKRASKALQPLPEGWQPSQSNAERLAALYRFSNGDLERYLAAFRDACAAKGYTYRDFDAAFANCVRADWPKFRGGAATMPKPIDPNNPRW